MKKIDVNTKNVVNFTNNTFSCIGTGRMDLALHKEYLDQLALCLLYTSPSPRD